MSTTLNEFKEKFKTDDLCVVKLNHWTWSMRPTHCTLGAGILSLNRFCTSFSDISPEEAEELSVITKEIENRLKSQFNPERFNYIMLMMVDAHLHFHVIPRYESSKEFAGAEWIDSGWPALPSLGETPAHATHETLKQIAELLRTS